MGFHVILKSDEKKVTSEYVEDLSDLVFISGITQDTIIYQGEPDWKPVRLGSSENYKNFAEDWFRAGIKAEKIFKKQAVEHGLIIENIAQDQESFKAYTSNVDAGIKRGDCLVRNVRNIEIEIKCLSYYPIDGKECIKIKFPELKKYEGMEDTTGCPIIIAFYKRDGDSPVEDSLRMISVKKIFEENNRRVIFKKIRDKEKGKYISYFFIPVELSEKGFKLIDRERKKIDSSRVR